MKDALGESQEHLVIFPTGSRNPIFGHLPFVHYVDEFTYKFSFFFTRGIMSSLSCW